MNSKRKMILDNSSGRVDSMVRKFWRSKWFIIALVIIILVPTFFMLVLFINFGQRQDEVLRYFSQQEGMPSTFTRLEQLTPSNATVLCWWDYGRAVMNWSHRQVIEAYPSRDIYYSVGTSRDLWSNIETQIFGTWGDSKKIHDMARMFMLPEDQSLQLMRSYGVSYVLVFTPDELQKFSWIAQFAGYNATQYLTVNNGNYQPTDLGSQVTLLRLLFDDTLHPTYFTKLFDNGRGKIYQINYP